MAKTFHLAIIPDGNRRWAKAHGVLPWEGHRTAVEKFRPILEWCRAHPRIGTLTLWGFSTENWKRSEREVRELMKLFESFLADERPRLVEHRTRFVHAGRKDRIPASLATLFRETEETTKDFAEFTLQLAIDYGGKDEIVRAVRGKALADDATEEIVRALLDHPDVPDIDLIVRTSGEQRISNFFLWQGAYAELLFLEKHFPELTTADLQAALDEYDRRQRRFGG